ncbi:MAG: glycosyltransferase [Cyanobacteriota bacterium]|nr:glycosyltransferase [Cyanobacteriota bacterium]
MTQHDQGPATDWCIESMLAIPCEEISDSAALCKNPQASVILMTRNHAAYIQKAAESVINQTTLFEYEILIGDDHSTDNTLEICRKLQAKHPEKIRLITAPCRVGITPNFLRLQSRSRAPFCALLEGDDYWTSPDKLQLQFNLLTAHPEFSWCGARTHNRIHPLPAQKSYTLSDTCRRFLVHTSTIMYRRSALDDYPRFPDMVGWISMVCVVLAQKGLCGFLDTELSYYRRHTGGVYTGANVSRRIKLAQSFTDIIRPYLNYTYDRDLFERELWICGWELKFNPSTFSLGQWLNQVWILLTKEVPRTIWVAPAKLLQLMLQLSTHPAAFVYFKLRTL